MRTTRRSIESMISVGRLVVASIWIAVCVFFWNTDVAAAAAAAAASACRPLNSIQLATGEWDVLIRGGFWMDASRIFPSVNSGKQQGRKTALSVTKWILPWKEKKKAGQGTTTIVPFVRRRPWGSSIDCSLSLASDGTFIMTPKYMETLGIATDRKDENNFLTKYKHKRRRENYETSNYDMDIQGTETTTIPRRKGLLDLRGSWNVLANPYCVTDRFYDKVTLRSYPRRKIDDDASEETTILQTIEWTLHCRMWGRHKRQIPNNSHNDDHKRRSTHRERIRFRMTHGTVVCNDCDVPWWKQFGRPVLGSFSAVRSSHEPKHEGWIDKELFGCSPE